MSELFAKVHWQLLGRLLKAQREFRKLTVRDAAPIIGVSSATISRVEGGEFACSSDSLVRICTWLEQPVDTVVWKP